MENFINRHKPDQSDESVANQAVNAEFLTMTPAAPANDNQGNAADLTTADIHAATNTIIALIGDNPELQAKFQALLVEATEAKNNNSTQNDNNTQPSPFDTLTNDPARVLAGFLNVKETMHVGGINQHNVRLFKPLAHQKANVEDYPQYINYFNDGEIEKAMAILEKNPHIIKQHNVNHFDWASPLIRAAWGEDKTLYDKLVEILEAARKAATEAKDKSYQPIPTEVYELYYLVVTGLGKRAENNETWLFEAKDYVEKHLKSHPDLILMPGPDGLSALQLAAAQLDFDLIETLLLAVTKNPQGVARALYQINRNRAARSPEKQYQLRIKTLIQNLPDDDNNNLKATAEAQLKAVRDNHWVLNGEPIIKEYTDCKTFSDNDAVYGGGANPTGRRAAQCQYRLSRAMYASILFHENGRNFPGLPPNPYRIHPPRDFKYFDNNKQEHRALFPKNYKELGGKNGILVVRKRGATATSSLGCRAWIYEDLNAVTGVFKARTEQLNDLIKAFSPAPAPSQNFSQSSLMEPNA